jgi:hypothetical protein
MFLLRLGYYDFCLVYVHMSVSEDAYVFLSLSLCLLWEMQAVMLQAALRRGSRGKERVSSIHT